MAAIRRTLVIPIIHICTAACQSVPCTVVARRPSSTIVDDRRFFLKNI
jgi:hypothetical protein